MRERHTVVSSHESVAIGVREDTVDVFLCLFKLRESGQRDSSHSQQEDYGGSSMMG